MPKLEANQKQQTSNKLEDYQPGASQTLVFEALKKVASYGEEKVFKPSRIGCPHFLLSPDKGTIEGITPPIEV